MAENTTTDDLRTAADEKDEKADALEALRDEVLDAERIGDTRLSMLFHEARTNRDSVWKSATAFVDIEDGEAVVDDVSKLRDGRWAPEVRDRHDAIVSVGVRPFMDTATFKAAVRDNLYQSIRGLRSTAEDLRKQADMQERRAEMEC